MQAVPYSLSRYSSVKHSLEVTSKQDLSRVLLALDEQYSRQRSGRTNPGLRLPNR